MGTNIGFHIRNGCLVKDTLDKKTVTGLHIRMVVLPNNGCLPFIYGVSADRYIIKS
jgi:hypothetical protein